MTKTLYLLRHAKSSWDQSGIEDHDCPLNARGIENATQMGQHMRGKGYAPALILCSSARRTRETLERIQPNLPRDGQIRYEPGLYLATPARMLALVQDTDDAIPSVMVIAHSPGTEGCALSLARTEAGREEQQRRAQIEEKFPTAALAVLTLPATRWRDIRPGTGALIAFIRPRDL